MSSTESKTPEPKKEPISRRKLLELLSLEQEYWPDIKDVSPDNTKSATNLKIINEPL